MDSMSCIAIGFKKSTALGAPAIFSPSLVSKLRRILQRAQKELAGKVESCGFGGPENLVLNHHKMKVH